MKRDAIVPAAVDSPLSNLAHFGFVTLPNFSMIAFTSAVEVLRMANYVGRAQHYRWSIITPDGEPARASNGITVKPATTIDETGMPDVLIVCGGWQVADYVDDKVIGLLQRAHEAGIPLGGICTGPYALLAAKLLDGYRCTLHWEDMSPVNKRFPHVRFADELFVIDRDRLTCTGGTAPLDLMLNLVGMRLGQAHAAQVSEQFIVERIRGSTDYQHIPVDARVGFSRAELVEVVRLMEANIEEPLSLDELARLVHLSQRHLQRMFKMFLSVSPTHYYLTLRLRRARELLRNTDASIARVTSVCGFHSPCHFSKAYRAQFGHAPSVERRLSA
ncbi:MULTISPECIES: GlxA family transcriptional regulator [unclassified Caballeronia]|uniref:GlxA family transcriptional regulator n=1 Tax=unclassified Caballeronia TaxID=2646786 RepID=UPI0028590E07|nr:MULTISPECIES: GlxA family transcriptional regulator [unclassified Caballeronia]MDR5818608.1 GlxA family transcriptional regulator [Caballeronia sp. LZ033]MDR5882162.1 GlxA family transcriptional regulator [Caballeronia sp. LZ032]